VTNEAEIDAVMSVTSATLTSIRIEAMIWPDVVEGVMSP